jgi:hypothetical protein
LLKKKAQTLEKVLKKGSYSFWLDLQIDADPDFYLMRIQVTKSMRESFRIRIHNTDCDFLQVSGASAGSIAALALLSGVPLGEITSNVLRIASEVGVAFMGTFFFSSAFFSFAVGRIFQFLIFSVLWIRIRWICN